ncbi:MAG TPA: hypothetical protein VF755_28570 [Catenuloplanes sp.]
MIVSLDRYGSGVPAVSVSGATVGTIGSSPPGSPWVGCASLTGTLNRAVRLPTGGA